MDINRRTPEHALPVFLLTGFLGSGKTTLLNYLLGHPDMDQAAVLINEFGDVGLDHLIVRELDKDVVLLKSGCICCTVQGQLVDGLKELYLKRAAGQIPHFQRIVIETTGLADPLPIINCIMRDPLFKRIYTVDTVVTTVDGVFGQAQLDRQEEAVRQAAIADHILITKSDLVDAASVDDLRLRLQRVNPGARIIFAHFGQVSPATLFGDAFFDIQRKSIDIQQSLAEDGVSSQHHDHHFSGLPAHKTHSRDHDDHLNVNRHDAHISSFCLTIVRPLRWETFNEWYGELAEKKGDHLLRVKGILNVVGEARPLFLHCVQSVVHEPTPLPSWPDDDRTSRIVFITRDLAREEIENSLVSCLDADHPVTDLASDEAKPFAAPLRPINGPRFLNQADLTRVFAAFLDLADRHAVDALRLMLLTGVGVEDVRTARWEEFDRNRKLWIKKLPLKSGGAPTRQERRIPLHSTPMLLISDLWEQRLDSSFLFSDTEMPTGRLEQTWREAIQAAGIESIALDALPPTLAADVFSGLDPSLVRSLLGRESHEESASVTPAGRAE